MSLLAHLRRSLRSLGCAPGSQLVIAVSGGADSLCLLHALVQLRPELQLALHVAHLDHGLRGAEGAADAAFVAATANAWNVAATIECRPVAPVAAASGLGTQAAARRVRYAFLAQVAQATKADAVVVAHNADDQAETVLMHMLRGAGSAGLRGMRAQVPWNEWAGTQTQPEVCFGDQQSTPTARLMRPLLDVPRAEIEAYCATHGLAPRNDPSNAAPQYTRSRVRHELLPQLRTYNSNIVAALGRSAQAIGGDYAFVQAALDDVWPQLARVEATSVRLDPTLLHGLHPALRRAALRRAVELLVGQGEALGFDQLEAAHEAALRRPGTHLGLPYGLQLDVTHEAAAISLGTLVATADVPQLVGETLALPKLGQVMLNNNWRVLVGCDPLGGRWGAAFDADALGKPLWLRRRHPGDRIRPVDGRGSRRLQDVFVDRKVPREQRAAWPIMVADDVPIWVVGLALDARVAAKETTARSLWIAFERRDNDAGL